MTYTKSEEKILALLQKDNRRSTSEIAGRLGLNYYYVLNVLTELERDGIVKSEKETGRIYWTLNKLKNKHGN